jgi:hypothetical protein
MRACAAQAGIRRRTVLAIGIVETPLQPPYDVVGQRLIGGAAYRFESLFLHVERRAPLEEAVGIFDFPDQISCVADGYVKAQLRRHNRGGRHKRLTPHRRLLGR